MGAYACKALFSRRLVGCAQVSALEPSVLLTSDVLFFFSVIAEESSSLMQSSLERGYLLRQLKMLIEKLIRAICFLSSVPALLSLLQRIFLTGL